MLFRFPPPNCQMTFLPTSFAQTTQLLFATSNHSLKSWPFAPSCQVVPESGFSGLLPRRASDTVHAFPFLLCYILDTSFPLTNQERAIFSAPILLPQPGSSLHFGACLSTKKLGSAPATLLPSFNLLTLVLCCPLLPVDHPGFFQKRLLHVLRADHAYAHRHLPFEQQGVPMRSFDALVTGLAHDGSCKSSHLPSCLHFQRSVSSKPSAALFRIFRARHLPPKQAWPWWKVLPHLQDFSLP